MTDMVMGRQDGAPQRRKPRANGFNKAKRQRFLDMLAATCNARRSAAAAGVDLCTPYYHRQRDPAFAEQWRAALAVGYDRLEVLVLEHAGGGEPPVPADPERARDAAGAPVAFDFERALKVLQQYRGVRAGETWRRAEQGEARASRAETNAAILQALDAAERRSARRTGPRGDGPRGDGQRGGGA